MKLLRKISLAVAFLIVAHGLLMAQLSLGVRGGVNLAKQSSKSDNFEVTTDAITGLTVAGIVELGLTKSIALQMEAAFVQKGGELEGFKTTLNHFDVPVLLKFKVGSGSFGAYLAAGPTFGYALSGESDGEKIDDWEGYNRFEIGASAGGGLGLNLSSGTVFLDARYLISITNLADDEGEDFTSRNRGIGLSIGYLHHLGE